MTDKTTLNTEKIYEAQRENAVTWLRDHLTYSSGPGWIVDTRHRFIDKEMIEELRESGKYTVVVDGNHVIIMKRNLALEQELDTESALKARLTGGEPCAMSPPRSYLETETSEQTKKRRFEASLGYVYTQLEKMVAENRRFCKIDYDGYYIGNDVIEALEATGKYDIVDSQSKWQLFIRLRSDNCSKFVRDPHFYFTSNQK